jgi:hypothetical protein
MVLGPRRNPGAFLLDVRLWTLKVGIELKDKKRRDVSRLYKQLTSDQHPKSRHHPEKCVSRK